MEIKNAQYTVFDGVKVGIRAEINGIISNVPMDENNIDYEEILKQVKEGTLTIKDAE
tara:strand:+ start:882 stop:1052 length:171 start_codon:yes stop_codon:yes gene_type:complete